MNCLVYKNETQPVIVRVYTCARRDQAVRQVFLLGTQATLELAALVSENLRLVSWT